MAVTRALLNKTIRVLVSFEEMPRIYVAKKTVSIHHFDIGSVARLILNYLVRFLVGGGICGQKWPEIASSDLLINGLTKVGSGTLNFSNNSITGNALVVNEGMRTFSGAVINSGGFTSASITLTPQPEQPLP